MCSREDQDTNTNVEETPVEDVAEESGDKTEDGEKVEEEVSEERGEAIFFNIAIYDIDGDNRRKSWLTKNFVGYRNKTKINTSFEHVSR